ncbi:MAG: hypothetical protein R3F62_28905 [Planctomycetota bacterium]
MTTRGEFTRKFDREILGDDSAAAEERAHLAKLQEAEQAALELEFTKLLQVLEYRAAWLRERFPGMREPKLESARGRRFEFGPSPMDKGRTVGWLEFRTRLTDSQQAVLLESLMELEGQFSKRHDYVTFPKEKVSIDKAKRFVESKILEFAGTYQDVYGGTQTG